MLIQRFGVSAGSTKMSKSSLSFEMRLAVEGGPVKYDVLVQSYSLIGDIPHKTIAIQFLIYQPLKGCEINCVRT